MSGSLYNLAVVLCLSLVANGAPVLASRLTPGWLAYPVDAGLCLRDGRRLLGDSKSWRGLIAALAATMAAAPLLGLAWPLGLLAGAAAMLGDLGSSFVKRRLGIGCGDMALGLDQVPEALLPALALGGPLDLGPGDIGAVVLLFFLLGIPLSRLMFRLGLRERPH